MTFAILITTAANPGLYTPPAVVPNPFPTGVHAIGVWLIVAGIVGGILLVGGLASLSEGGLIEWLSVIGGLILCFGATGLAMGQTDAADTKHAAFDAKHTHAVATYDTRYEDSLHAWLHDNYGITADTNSVHTLRTGGQLVATTGDGQKLIELAATTDAQLAVRIVGGSILQPVTH